MPKEEIVLQVDHISKQYRLGTIGTGTISHDLNRWWHKIRSKEDPYAKIGEINDRSILGGSYVWAIKDISFQVKKGEILGIIGKNGAGKSTLLKLLSQITSPTSGEIKIKGRVASLLEVGTGFHPELTGRENIFLNGAILGMSKKEIQSKIDEIILFSGCAKYIETPVKRYSSGMIVRLGFAIAAFLDPEILIIDEVLAVGDAEFQKKCIGKMQEVSQSGRTVLFVSHNLTSIKELCTSALIIDKGSVSYSGDVTEAINRYTSSNLFEGYNENPTYTINTKEADIKYIKTQTRSGKLSKNFAYKEDFSILFEIDFFRDFKNAVIDLSIGTKYDKVVYISSFDSFNGIININKGVKKITVPFINQLLPGTYYLSLGFHVNDGDGIATKLYLEFCHEINVSSYTLEGKNNYPFKINFGHTFNKVDMKIDEPNV